MNSMEEQLWNYIDDSCAPDEQKAIELLIEQNDAYRNKYNELLQLNSEFATMELDEPPMAFTYNIMEQIRTEHAQKPLKASIDKRIIWGITGFFIITITAIVIFALSTVNWGGHSLDVKMPNQLNVTHIKSYFSGPIVKGFLFFDVVMGLFLIDSYLRRKAIKGSSVH